MLNDGVQEAFQELADNYSHSIALSTETTVILLYYILCLNFARINKLWNISPVYWDTNASRIMTVQLGSTLCMSCSKA